MGNLTADIDVPASLAAARCYAVLIGIVAAGTVSCAILVGNQVSYSWLKLTTAIADRFPQ